MKGHLKMNKIANFGQRVLSLNISSIFNFLFYGLILVAPIVVYGVSVKGVSLRLSRLFIILLVPIVFIKIAMKPSLILRDKFFMFAILPYAILITLSITWTRDNLFEFGLNRLASLYEVLFVYVVLIVADLSIEKFKIFIKYYLASAFLPALIALREIANNIFLFSQSQLPFNSFLIAGKYEEFRGRWNLMTDNVSRASSTFAEPTIWGSFMSTVFLFSLSIEPKTKKSTIGLRLFQLLILIGLMASVAKLAIVILVVGIILIFRKHKKSLGFLGLGAFVVMLTLYFVLQRLNLGFFLNRFTTDSGHMNLILKTIAQLESVSILIGDGIGSIPTFTTNKFILSRMYEGGLLGSIFVLQFTLLPFKILFQKKIMKDSGKIKDVCVGITFALVLGLHIYDYFIYIWFWIVIGAIMSLYNSSKYSKHDELLEA